MRRLISLIVAGLICLTLFQTGVAIAHELEEGGAHHAAAHEHSSAPDQTPDDHDGKGLGVHAHDAAGHLQALTPSVVQLRLKERAEPLRSPEILEPRQSCAVGIDRPPRAA